MRHVQTPEQCSAAQRASEPVTKGKTQQAKVTVQNVGNKLDTIYSVNTMSCTDGFARASDADDRIALPADADDANGLALPRRALRAPRRALTVPPRLPARWQSPRLSSHAERHAAHAHCAAPADYTVARRTFGLLHLFC